MQQGRCKNGTHRGYAWYLCQCSEEATIGYRYMKQQSNHRRSRNSDNRILRYRLAGKRHLKGTGYSYIVNLPENPLTNPAIQKNLKNQKIKN